MAAGDSRGESSSEGEWEEEAGSGGGPRGVEGDASPGRLSRPNSKHFRAAQPGEAEAAEQGGAGEEGLARCGGGGAGAGPAGQVQPLATLGSLDLGWGSEPDFAAVEAEVEAALAPVDAQLAALGPELGSEPRWDSGTLLDLLPLGLARLERQLSRDAPSASDTEACPSAGQSSRPSSGEATAAPLAGGAAPAAPTQHKAASGSASGSAASSEQLLSAALRMQLEMQKQLSDSMEVRSP